MIKRFLPILFLMIISGCDESSVYVKRGEAHREYHEKNGFDFNKRCYGCEVAALEAGGRSHATVVNTCYKYH